MAARSGSFGGSLNPFGSGGASSFSQYDISSNLAELEVYRVEVAWGNGTATDDEYLAALTKARDATLTDTRDRESAQNRLDDAVYRIGRSKVENDLDKLIAFDQAALGKMDTDNLKYRSVKDSLDSELAQRRSRDYGDLVRKYNNGEISTEKLKAWVDTALTGISPEDPDYKNWTGTRDDLEDRITSEADDKVYQDYQQGRMKPDAFLSYLRGRQDDYDPESPQYDDWARKVEDATKTVKKDELAKKDQAFFNAYQEGHKSDASYLKYIRDRVSGMDPDDPDLADWKHRLVQATFSLAEDKLRFDVENGKAPKSKLISFYRNYQRTLNPGSQEWRTVARALKSLGSGAGVGGGGGGGGGRGGSRSSSAKPTAKPLTASEKTAIGQAFVGKVLSGGIVSATVGMQGRINPYAKDAKTRAKILDGNIQRARDAIQNGDSTFLYINPDLGVKGPTKGVMIAATNGIFTELSSSKVDYNFGRAAKALAAHDLTNYNYYLNQALNGQNDIRVNQAQYHVETIQKGADALFDAIDSATKTGNVEGAFGAAVRIKEEIDRARKSDPNLTDATRKKLDAMEARLDGLDIIPKIDANGNQVGGIIDINGSTITPDGVMTKAAMMPGWHFVLDKSANGQDVGWGFEHDPDLLPDDEWAAGRLEVHTTYGGQVVTGSVKINKTAAFNPTAYANLPDGTGQIQLTLPETAGVTYKDEHGKVVRAYSLDGETWVRSMSGTTPSVQFNFSAEDGLKQTKDASGAAVIIDSKGTVVFSQDPSGSWQQNNQYFQDNPGKFDWYGMGDLRKRRETLGKVTTHDASGRVRQGQFVSGYEEQYLYGAGRSTLGRAPAVNGGVSVGAPGQAMQVVTKSDTGQLNLTGSDGWGENDNGSRGNTARPGGEDSFAPMGAKKTTPKSSNPAARTRSTRAGRVADKARMYGEDARDLLDGPSNGSGISMASYVQSRPSIRAQLPANTPDRFDGEGLRRTAVSPPALKPYASTVQQGLNSRAPVIPPALKATPKPPLRTPAKNRVVTKRSVTKRKAPAPKVKGNTVVANAGAKINSGAAQTNRSL